MRRFLFIAAAVALLAGCKYCLAPIAWVYQLGHPPAECLAPLPSDGRGYECEYTDAGTQWVCVERCTDATANQNIWPDSGFSTVEDVTDLPDGG